jgi:hypothetical protein
MEKLDLRILYKQRARVIVKATSTTNSLRVRPPFEV